MGFIVDLEVVKFSAIECRLQMSGELSVAWMVDGFIYAQDVSKDQKYPTVSDVINLGRLIEPNENAYGFRTSNIQIGNEIIGWEYITQQIVPLCEAAYTLTPDEWFYEYEKIHPFRDGNGRTGAILFNWLNGTLYKPVWAKNFFNDPRRTVGHGA